MSGTNLHQYLNRVSKQQACCNCLPDLIITVMITQILKSKSDEYNMQCSIWKMHAWLYSPQNNINFHEKPQTNNGIAIVPLTVGD